MQQQVFFQDLGIRSYKEIWDYQETLLKENVTAKSNFSNNQLLPSTTNHLLFVEHTPVYTLGKSGKKEHVLIDEATMQEKGIEYFHINRGGDITFHGLQQIVGYPILDLDKFKPDLGWYLRSLEEVIILTMAQYGIVAGRSKGETGVWIDADIPGKERKICAMGIKCSRWITMHGFAFNVNTNLEHFDLIVPCGISDKKVVSIEKLIGKKADYDELVKDVFKYYCKIFKYDTFEILNLEDL